MSTTIPGYGELAIELALQQPPDDTSQDVLDGPNLPDFPDDIEKYPGSQAAFYARSTQKEDHG